MSLWRAEMIESRRRWAKARDPRLDRKAGPLEVAPGIPLRSVLKFSGFIIVLSGIIAWANNRAYQKLYSEKKYSGSVFQSTAETKRMLRDGAADKVHLTPREEMAALLERVRRETNDWDESRLSNTAVDRPVEGLTAENLREAGMGMAAFSDSANDKLRNMLEEERKKRSQAQQ
ncbi:hypothetical protein DIPPA_31633 [Diplonema papillatum]|nr:hypothetical protein DIPPA_31633 [Diplonema papillatum]